jgi:BirA family biotin operon repressor/biotin-[acetyl-CoA-carboxylase] ligase
MDSSFEWLKAYNFISFETTTSTNDQAFNLAKEEVLHNHVISAKSQSSGRGSKGRKWISEAGNLYFSILLVRFDDIAYTTIFSFMMANIVDILLNQKKIAGILVESITINEINYVVIGVGININHHPILEDRRIMISSLLKEGIIISDTQIFLNKLINQFDRQYKIWQQNKNFESIKNYWLSRAYKLGDEVNINLAGKNRTGIFRGLGIDGQLIMQLPNNGDIIYYYSGELT